MLLGKRPIKSITCEHKDDIDVEEDSKIKYYQVKSTTTINKLPNYRIIDAIKLFSSIATNENDDNEYIIVSNGNIPGIKELGVLYPFNKIEEKTLQRILSHKEIKSKKHILDRVYVLKGPPLEEIEHIVFALLHKAIHNPNFEHNIEGVKDDLLRYNNNICPGPTNLEDIKIIKESEKEQYDLNFKTITLDILNKIIEKHKLFSPKQSLRSVEKSLILKSDILPPHANEEQINKIHKFINEYKMFSTDDEYKFGYLKIFNEISDKFDIYNDRVFLDFLKSELENSNNKHIILECLFILSKLIIYGKKDEVLFMEYINKDTFH